MSWTPTDKDVYGQEPLKTERWLTMTAISYITKDGIVHPINWKCTPKDPCLKGHYHHWFTDYFKHRGIEVSAIIFKPSI